MRQAQLWAQPLPLLALAIQWQVQKVWKQEELEEQKREVLVLQE